MSHPQAFLRRVGHGLAGDRRAAVAVFAAIVLPVLLGTAALALEVGTWAVTRIRLQRAADLAAFAGAARLGATKDEQVAAGVAADVAAVNGVAATGRSWNAANRTLSASAVKVEIVAGVRAASNQAVKVTASRAVPLSLGRLLSDAASVTVSSVAWAELVKTGGGGGQPCLVALKSGGAGITYTTGRGSTNTLTCTVRSNAGVAVTGDTRLTAPWVYAAGAANLEDSCWATNEITDGTTIVRSRDVLTRDCIIVWPNPWPKWQNGKPLTQYADKIPDPYGTDPRLAAALDALGTTSSNAVTVKSGASRTISPGVYGDITVTDDGTLTMTPGTYNLGSLSVTRGSRLTMGAGLYRINGNLVINGGSTVTGQGVTMVASGTMNISGGPYVTLSAPLAETTGSGISGMLFASKSGGASSMTGSGHPLNMTGVIYVPNGPLTVSLVVGVDECLEVIAASVLVTGGASLSANCSKYGAITFDSLPGSTRAALVQ